MIREENLVFDERERSYIFLAVTEIYKIACVGLEILSLCITYKVDTILSSERNILVFLFYFTCIDVLSHCMSIPLACLVPKIHRILWNWNHRWL